MTKSTYVWFAEKLQFISPKFYKSRFFKNIIQLSRDNYSERNVEPELVWIKDFLHRSDVVIDIGANVGTYLFQLENKLRPENIYAFEPNKKLYLRLKRIFPAMQIFPLAISDENTTAEFKIPIISGKKIHSRGTLKTQFVESGEENQKSEMVQVVKLDDWAEIENFKKLNLIKIDVEGNERQTLLGAQNTIKKFRPVLLVEMEQRHHQNPIWELVSIVENWGYEAHYLDRADFLLKKVTQNQIDQQNQNQVKDKRNYINNIIFLPKN